MSSRARTLVIALLLTTAGSLIYELVWLRHLSAIVGGGAVAGAILLSLFMLGLAVGSLISHTMLQRVKRLYMFLAVCEVIIALSGLCMVLITRAWTAQSVSYILIGLALLIPTICIGLVFPIIVSLYTTMTKHTDQDIGFLYAWDTFGAVVGVTVAAFFLIPTLGLWQSSLIAAVCNGIAACLLLRIHVGPKEALVIVERKREAATIKKSWVVGILYFFSGLAALCFEVLWMRHFVMIFGSSFYTFAVVTIVFLLGLSLGSYIISRRIGGILHPRDWFIFLETGIAFFGMLTLILFPVAERFSLFFYYISATFEVHLLWQIVLALVVIGVPTLFMGMTLALVCRIAFGQKNDATGVGFLYGINALGGIVGALLAGFVIIPMAGIYHGVIIAAGIYMAVAVASLWFLEPGEKKQSLPIIVFVVVAGLLMMLLVFRPAHFYCGAFYGPIRNKTAADALTGCFRIQQNKTLFHRDSVYGEVRVTVDPADPTNVKLRNNGKTDATGRGDVEMQLLLAYIPLLLHANPQSVFNIGTGGGWTLEAIEDITTVTHIESIEIDPVVIQAAQTVLAPYNGQSLQDPRAQIITGDGRWYLAASKSRYDVIISEPPNIWVSGVSSLFTQEFYRLASAHLRSGGLLAQWLPAYEMTKEDYGIAVKTISSVFPYVYEFRPGAQQDVQGDVIILASLEPVDTTSMQLQRISKDARAIHLMGGLPEAQIAYLSNYFSPHYVRGPEALRTFVAEETRLHTDNTPILEFMTFRHRYWRFQK